VNGFEVLIKHFLDQASVFFYVPDNDKGDIWTEGSPAGEVALLAFPVKRPRQLALPTWSST
jgi:hypothetical protein